MANFTINNAPFQLLGYDPSQPSLACAGGAQLTPTYLPLGVALIDATALWSEYDQIGTGTIIKGYYSDGVIYRYYSETAEIGPYVYCGGENTTAINVGVSGNTGAEACLNFATSQTTIYVPFGFTFLTAERFFQDAAGTQLLDNNIFSDGVNWMQWQIRSGVFLRGTC